MQKRTLKKELGISRPTKSRSQIKPDKDEHGSAYMICDLPAEVPQNKAQKICRKNFKKLFEKKRYTFWIILHIECVTKNEIDAKREKIPFEAW